MSWRKESVSEGAALADVGVALEQITSMASWYAWREARSSRVGRMQHLHCSADVRWVDEEEQLKMGFSIC